MKLHKKLTQCQFNIGCVDDENNIGTNNGNYEQYARITMWKIGSNTYKVITEEFDGDITKLNVYEEFICRKKNVQNVWENLFIHYGELEILHTSDLLKED